MKAEQEAAAELQKSTEKFKAMTVLSPAESFLKLSAELEKVRASLSAEEIAAAGKKLAADLAKMLGIDSFVNPVKTDTLAEVHAKIADYANRTGMSQENLIAAQNRATAAFEKQSEMFGLYQRAQDAMLTSEQKLAKTFEKIDAEAKKFNWSNKAVNKMKDLAKTDIASGLGIAEYLKPDMSGKDRLNEIYNSIAAYAKEAHLADKELNAAKRRAAESMMKQSEYYSLYQKAQESLIPIQTRLRNAFEGIEKEAKAWGWSKETAAKMKEMKQAEMLGSKESKRESNQNNNTALEFGTVAYYEAQMRGNKPLLDENKRQTKHLAVIEKCLVSAPKKDMEQQTVF
jgi:hypothetical protein